MPTLTFDLHTHLFEKEIHPEVYWKWVKKKKIDVIAITEHIEEKPKMAFELLMEKKPSNIVLLPGVELNTSIGHVLAIGKDAGIYGIKEFMQKGLDMKRAIELAKEHNVLLSISHPWGFSYDSASYIIGEKKLEKIVEKGCIGVEAFNGMMGSVGNFVYGTNWVRKPLNFFDFLEKNRVARKTRLSKIGKKLRKKIDKKSREVIERCAKPIELGEKAAFITAGSDAHSASRIGSGIMKIESNEKKVDAAKALELIAKKQNVVWAGPFVEERADGSYKVVKESPNKMEVIAGFRYATIRKGGKKLGKLGSKIKKKIKRKKK